MNRVIMEHKTEVEVETRRPHSMQRPERVSEKDSALCGFLVMVFGWELQKL